MCEFVVYLVGDGGKEREVVAVEHVSIEVVDTLMQELILRKERDE
jgi:hypothetical protein